MSENMEKDYKQIERQTAADYEYSTLMQLLEVLPADPYPHITNITP